MTLHKYGGKAALGKRRAPFNGTGDLRKLKVMKVG